MVEGHLPLSGAAVLQRFRQPWSTQCTVSSGRMTLFIFQNFLSLGLHQPTCRYFGRFLKPTSDANILGKVLLISLKMSQIFDHTCGSKCVKVSS